MCPDLRSLLATSLVRGEVRGGGHTHVTFVTFKLIGLFVRERERELNFEGRNKRIIGRLGPRLEKEGWWPKFEVCTIVKKCRE